MLLAALSRLLTELIVSIYDSTILAIIELSYPQIHLQTVQILVCVTAHF